MKRVRDGLGAVLLVCLLVRIGAWLVGPVIPLLACLLLLAALACFLFKR